MVTDIHDEHLLRQFVLGELSGGVRDRIEEAVIVDADYCAELSGVEDELVLMYVRNELDRSLRARFVKALDASPSLREHVESTKALTEVARERTAPTRQRSWGWLGTPPRFAFALAGGAAVLVLAAVLVFREYRQPATQAALVTPPSAATQPRGAVVTLFLAPSLRRDDGSQVNVGRIPAGTEQLELRLVVAGLNPTNLEAQLRLVRGADLRTTEGPSPVGRPTPDGLDIGWSVPAQLLAPGDYLLTIIGDVAGRPRGTVATRFFSIE